MPQERSIRSAPAGILPQIAAGVALVALSLALASPSCAQSYGYSYMRISVDGSPVTNFVHDQKYVGWLQVESVMAEPALPAVHSARGAASPGATPKPQKDHDDRWARVPAILHSGRSAAGKLRFGAGDDGNLQPLIEAHKHKTKIPEAELDLYDEEKSLFIGKYKLKGIRILSLEDVPASACAMYLITVSYVSIEKQ